MLGESVICATEMHHFDLIAFVWMPEHVHLLVLPQGSHCSTSALLRAIKRPFSFRIKRLLEPTNTALLRELTVRQRPGVTTFRFWQEGPGYDRNLEQADTIRAAIDYVHLNPARRSLCERAVDWKWSSARDFLLDQHDRDLPRTDGVAWQLLE